MDENTEAIVRALAQINNHIGNNETNALLRVIVEELQKLNVRVDNLKSK